MTDKTTVWQRFAQAKASMPAPVRDTDAYKYQYADLAQVKSIIDPALFKHGFYAQQTLASGTLTTEVIDTETGQAVATDTRHVLVDGTDQMRGSSETYQRRYALMTICGLAPEDDDGAAASQVKQSGNNNNLKAAKERLWAAVKAYAERSGGDADKLAAGCKDRADYAETAEWYTLVAEEFETA